jgi:xanthine dehydrogenase accessory factor
LAALRASGISFATATVVARKAPVSVHLGDSAIVFEDGRIEGYIGGGCSREILRAQALIALRTAEPRLVRISPDSISSLPGYPDDGEVDHYVRIRMTCASQGALDLYVEPYTAKPRLAIAGATPVALAVATLGRFLEFEVRLVQDPEEASSGSAGEDEALLPDELASFLGARSERKSGALVVGVVASMGEYDDIVLEALLRAQADYIGLVASRQRCSAVLASLRNRGMTESDLAAVRNPAGINIGAKTPAEVALSIMADVIGCVRGTRRRATLDAESHATDPICGMGIAITGATYSARSAGETHYFCSVGCKRAFVDAAKSRSKT